MFYAGSSCLSYLSVTVMEQCKESFVGGLWFRRVRPNGCMEIAGGGQQGGLSSRWELASGTTIGKAKRTRVTRHESLETSKPSPRDILSPAWPWSPNPPQIASNWVTSILFAETCGASHSNDHSSLPQPTFAMCLHCSISFLLHVSSCCSVLYDSEQ